MAPDLMHLTKTPRDHQIIKYLKADDKPINRPCPKRESKLITWGNIRTLSHQAEETTKTNPKMMLLYLINCIACKLLSMHNPNAFCQKR